MIFFLCKSSVFMHFQIKSNQICIAQNLILHIISLIFDKLYGCDILCPETLEPDEEKVLKKKKKP